MRAPLTNADADAMPLLAARLCNHHCHHSSKKSLIVTLVDLLGIPNASTRFIKDAFESLFSLALYSLNRIALIELGIMLPLFALVVKDGGREVVEDATMMIVQLVECNKSVEVLWRMDDINIIVDLVIGGS
ncbi:uncharacterized protein LOC135679792 [Musa acuminata AAA Group]|uniref:uncharacterized protein LOC135679792 n=1 Tax=Musa acuminata AAA Group TaxID=214697 RepID=UPI0031D0E827